MSNKENMSLDEVMGTKPNVNHIDLTKGGTPAQTEAATEAADAQPVARRARPVVTGPIDFSTMKDADVDKILPRRQPKPSPEEENMMSALDLAVAREKEKITERIDAVIEAQDQEIEEAEARAEEEELDRELAGETYYANSLSTYDEYENDDRYDETPVTLANAKRVTIDMDSEEESIGIEEDEEEYDVETIMTDPVQTEVRTPIHSLEVENHEDAVLDKEADIPSATTEKAVAQPVIKEELIRENNDDDFDLMKELGLDDDEEEAEAEATTGVEDEDNKKLLEDVKAQIKERVEPIRRAIDISKFTISKKAVSAQKVMKMAVKAHQTVADWMLYTAEKPISVYGLSGSEILKLNPEGTTRNRLNTFKDIYHIIYDHIIDANKPEFETWLKKTNFVDLEHIYFALYMATFGNSNFINLECPKCKKIFIKDVKIEDMIEYANDEAKAKVRNIMRQDSTTHKKDEYDVDIVQISNTYAFAIKTPSIWSVIIETASLTDRVLERYSDLVDVISYIDTIYIINEATSELVPIDYKIDPNDQNKTSARRIKAFYDVISSLSSEDYFYLRNVIAEYDKNVSDISYIIPEATCPECGATIEANKEITADALVFTRHQLAAIGNM